MYVMVDFQSVIWLCACSAQCSFISTSGESPVGAHEMQKIGPSCFQLSDGRLWIDTNVFLRIELYHWNLIRLHNMNIGLPSLPNNSTSTFQTVDRNEQRLTPLDQSRSRCIGYTIENRVCTLNHWVDIQDDSESTENSQRSRPQSPQYTRRIQSA